LYLEGTFSSLIHKACLSPKGAGFYYRLAADVGTVNPKKSALETFIDNRTDFWFGGPFLLGLYRKLAIVVLGPPRLPS